MLRSYLEDVSACELGPESRLLLKYARELTADRDAEAFELEELLESVRAEVRPNLAGLWLGDRLAWRLLIEESVQLALEGGLGAQVNVTLQPGEDGALVRLTLADPSRAPLPGPGGAEPRGRPARRPAFHLGLSTQLGAVSAVPGRLCAGRSGGRGGRAR